MTKTELLELILNGENSVVEFKNDAVENHRVARELVGFLNSYGGVLLLGVDDEGTVSGITRENIGEWVTNLCRDKIRPEIIPRIEILREVEPGKSVAVVQVEPGYTVHCVWHNNHRNYYIRAVEQTREPSTEELERLLQRRGNLRAELRPITSANLDEFDFDRLTDYFQRIRGQNPPETHELDAWRLLLENTELMTSGESGSVGTLAGILLFGKNPERFLPFTGMDAAAYPGVEKDYNAIERLNLRDPMTPDDPNSGSGGIVEEAMAFIRRHVGKEEVLQADTRRETEYFLPLEAVREGLVNALVHRDYLLTASNIELSIYSDRIEIISPGRPPNGINPDRMRVGCRAARNQLIKDTMRDYGYMEHMGMGIPRKMYALMEKEGLPPPEITLDEESTRVCLRWAGPVPVEK